MVDGPPSLGVIVCWGELLWDLFPSGPALGGAAANVAVNLLRLGATPLLVSRVGRDALGNQAGEIKQTFTVSQ